MQEKRKHHRLPRQDKTMVHRDAGQKEVTLLDISLGGMRVMLDEELKIGTILTLQVKILPHAGAFHVRGEVLWVKPSSGGHCETGVRFSKVSTIPL